MHNGEPAGFPQSQWQHQRPGKQPAPLRTALDSWTCVQESRIYKNSAAAVFVTTELAFSKMNEEPLQNTLSEQPFKHQESVTQNPGNGMHHWKV